MGNHFSQLIQKPDHGICKRVLQGLKALSAFLVEQAYRISDGAQVSSERRRIAEDNIPWQVIDDPEKLAQDLQYAVYAALQETLPTLSETHPTFDAQDFLDQDPIPSVSSSKKATLARGQKDSSSTVNGVKRKGIEMAAADSPSSKTAKFRHFDKTKNPKTINGHRSISEQIERSAPSPVSTTNMEMRTRPAITIIDADVVSTSSPHPTISQKAEVKTTVAENSVRKTVPGPEEGSWIVETRKVITTIERVYFPPLNRQERVGDVHIEGGESETPDRTSMRIDSYAMSDQAGHITKKETNGHVDFNALNGTSAAAADECSLKAEISKMLDLAQFDIPSSNARVAKAAG